MIVVAFMACILHWKYGYCNPTGFRQWIVQKDTCCTAIKQTEWGLCKENGAIGMGCFDVNGSISPDRGSGKDTVWVFRCMAGNIYKY